jgi:ATP-dependent Lon protease
VKFFDELGNIDYDGVTRNIKQYIPNREDYEQFKFQMVNGESVRFLAHIRVGIDIETGKTTFESWTVFTVLYPVGKSLVFIWVS